MQVMEQFLLVSSTVEDNMVCEVGMYINKEREPSLLMHMYKMNNSKCYYT